MVTNMQQAVRVYQLIGFSLMEEVIGFNVTGDLFTVPRDPRTECYITGYFG